MKGKRISRVRAILRSLKKSRIVNILALIVVVWSVVFFLTIFNKEKDSTENMPKKDWNNYGSREESMDLQGESTTHRQRLEPPGEMGKPVLLKNLTKEEDLLVKAGLKRHSFNQYVSDLVAFNRTVPDFRDKGCLSEKYRKPLPATSIIICFHNEAWSTLLRTVHSILNRSPPELVKEIILVDDYSYLPDLGKALETYLSHLSPMGKVRLVRTKRREGLVRGRLLGLSESTAEIITFLDSHCWLEPLLDRIARNESTVVSPTIDIIKPETLEYVKAKFVMGGFAWDLTFNWYPIPERILRRRKNTWDPFWTATIAGGLFSISRRFFDKIGTYDSGFNIWGGENLEISFKTWMCGGVLEIAPCSRVGHIFRWPAPYQWVENPSDVTKKNNLRLAEVWLDDFAKFYYYNLNNHLIDFGNVTERKALRKNLQCQSFDWYLRNIYPEHFLLNDSFAVGKIQNLEFKKDMCLMSNVWTVEKPYSLELYRCQEETKNQWIFSRKGEIRQSDFCVEYNGKRLTFEKCRSERGNRLWIYNHQLRQIKHVTGKCMEANENDNQVNMNDCNIQKKKQHWTFENYNNTNTYFNQFRKKVNN